MTRQLTVDDLHWTLRETVRWAVTDLGWTVEDAWESASWGDKAGCVDHCVQLTNGPANVFLMVAGIGDHVVVVGAVRVWEDGHVVDKQRLVGLREIAPTLMEHGTIDLREAS